MLFYVQAIPQFCVEIRRWSNGEVFRVGPENTSQPPPTAHERGKDFLTEAEIDRFLRCR